MVYKPTNITGGPHPVRLAPVSFPSDFSIAEMQDTAEILLQIVGRRGMGSFLRRASATDWTKTWGIPVKNGHRNSGLTH